MIKHIYNKCTIKLLVSIDSRIKSKLITVGFIVEDEPDNPFCTFYTINNKSDLNAFILAIKRRYNKLHLFDELSRNVLSGELIISKDVNDSIKFFDGNIINIDIGLDEKRKNEDLFLKNFVSLYKGETPQSDYWFDIDLEFLPNSSNKILDLDAGAMQIDQLDEGAGMEQSIYQLINSFFEKDSYHSPFYYNRNIEKELTDILILSQQYSVLIESKTIKVMYRDKPLTVDRMIRNIDKSITQGFGQLRGALRTIRSHTDVFTTNKNSIIIQQENRDNIHSVVLIPEMYSQLN